HTRFSRDWSSDVCSSDLIHEAPATDVTDVIADLLKKVLELFPDHKMIVLPISVFRDLESGFTTDFVFWIIIEDQADHRLCFGYRSEERRVGKECSSRGWS